MDLDYRSWGKTKNCKGCRYWSEMLAKVDGCSVKAMCINKESQNIGNYTFATTTCIKWKSGELGAVDSPGYNNDYDILGIG